MLSVRSRIACRELTVLAGRTDIANEPLEVLPICKREQYLIMAGLAASEARCKMDWYDTVLAILRSSVAATRDPSARPCRRAPELGFFLARCARRWPGTLSAAFGNCCDTTPVQGVILDAVLADAPSGNAKISPCNAAKRSGPGICRGTQLSTEFLSSSRFLPNKIWANNRRANITGCACLSPQLVAGDIIS